MGAERHADSRALLGTTTRRFGRQALASVPVALAALVLAAPAAQGALVRTSIAGVGVGPRQVTTGDFNHDGIQDLATANVDSSSVSILLGDGDGTFTTAPVPNYTVGMQPADIVAADFNGDGRQDLATAGFGVNTVSVLLGNGNGTFIAGTPLATGTNPWGIAAGDFNSDAIVDLAVTNSTAGTVSVFRGTVGGFVLSSTPATNGASPVGVAVGDFDGDGDEDLVTANRSGASISVLIGNGSGGFAGGVPYAAGPSPYRVSVAEINGDSVQDLAVATSTGLMALRGNPNGTFVTPGAATVVGQSEGLAVGDINADGLHDLLVSDRTAATLSVLPGVGTGIFAATTPLEAGQLGSIGVTVGDFDADGNQDAATANRGSASVSVFRNNDPPEGGNLLAGARAEGAGASGASVTTPAPPGWIVDQGRATFIRFGSPGLPTIIAAPRTRGGMGLFFGGPAAESSMYQQVAVAGHAASIDAGLARIGLSGLLGGRRIEGDSAEVTATFLGAGGAPIGTAAQIGPVTPGERRNLTTLLPRSTTAAVPGGTRTIRVRVTFRRASGDENDGYADNLRLTIDAPVPPPPPPPPPPPDPDADGDGVPASRDCNDSNPAIAPGRPEILSNGVDDNCDGRNEFFSTMTSVVELSWSRLRNGRTRINRLVLSGVRNGDVATLRCTGRGCTKKAGSRKNGTKITLRGVKRGRVALTKNVRNIKLANKAKLTITVARPQHLAVVTTYSMRSRKDPTKLTRCQAPGATNLTRC